MIILTIRTDKPQAEVGLFANDQQLAYETWEAHRNLAESIHHKILAVLNGQAKSWSDIQALIVYTGPGSFTGLRIGGSVANALAMAHNLPVVAVEGQNWILTGHQKLQKGGTGNHAVLVYGSPPHITRPKK